MSKNQQRHKNAYRAGYLAAVAKLKELPASPDLEAVIKYLENSAPEKPKESDPITQYYRDRQKSGLGACNGKTR